MMRAPSILSHLSRRTTSGQFIPEIDGLRFISIALVVFFHLSGYTVAKSVAGHFDNPTDNLVALFASTGHYGVQLFFVISGLVLALPFARFRLLHGPRPSLRAYYVRRLTRLEPPYIAAMIGIFIIAVAYYGAHARALMPHLLASLVYLHNVLYAMPSTVNVVAWSLEVEVQFYVLAPLMALVFVVPNARIRRLGIVAAIVAALVLQGTAPFRDPRLALSLANYIQFFLLGFLIADLYVVAWVAPSAHERAWDAVGILSWIALVVTWMDVARPTALFLTLALLIFCATFRGRLLRRAFCNPWLTTIGGMCYSIYLLHYPLISALGRHTGHIANRAGFTAHLLVQAVILVPMVLLASTVFFVVIERPCMRKDWPSRLAAAVRFESLESSRNLIPQRVRSIWGP